MENGTSASKKLNVQFSITHSLNIKVPEEFCSLLCGIISITWFWEKTLDFMFLLVGFHIKVNLPEKFLAGNKSHPTGCVKSHLFHFEDIHVSIRTEASKYCMHYGPLVMNASSVDAAKYHIHWGSLQQRMLASHFHSIRSSHAALKLCGLEHWCCWDRTAVEDQTTSSVNYHLYYLLEAW